MNGETQESVCVWVSVCRPTAVKELLLLLSGSADSLHSINNNSSSHSSSSPAAVVPIITETLCPLPVLRAGARTLPYVALISTGSFVYEEPKTVLLLFSATLDCRYCSLVWVLASSSSAWKYFLKINSRPFAKTEMVCLKVIVLCRIHIHKFHLFGSLDWTEKFVVPQELDSCWTTGLKWYALYPKCNIYLYFTLQF